ncbi:MAG: SDR family oxidoreductase [Alphaproteobacteria bacterium]|nr:SDR family oxidoreductase [Alphaproteobacteria bacterium]
MKRIIITGASDGLGKEFAKLCIADGIEIVNLSRSRPDYDCAHIPTDLADEHSIVAAANIIKEKYSEFDALVHCAGLFSGQPVGAIDYAELEATMRVNAIAPIFLTSLLFDLIKKNGADVLNVISTAALGGKPNHITYGASKYAQRGFGDNLRVDLAKSPCRVINVFTGGMNTNFFKKYDGSDKAAEFMNPEYVAKEMLSILKTPKQIEISDIIINRKKS